MVARIISVLFFIPFLTIAQVQQFPYTEHFDADTLLPAGWSSSENRDTSKNDFTITTSSPHSSPHAVISTNATVSQILYSPFFDFSIAPPETLYFFERRSPSHNSGLLVETSNDSGQIFFPISDTLKNISTSYVLRTVALPDSLAGRTNVRFRWRIIGDGTGAPGTIRFDNISLTTAMQIDVAVTSLSLAPLFPFVNDTIAFRATIKNLGNDSIQNIPVEFYVDANNDSLAQSSELISSGTIGTTLYQNDSATAQASTSFSTAGTYRIIVRATVAGDEDSTNNTQTISISVGWEPLSLVVNEIMYWPTAPEPEWIELTSTISDSINLRGWKISDKTTSTRYTMTNKDFWLHQNEFVVLTKDSAAFIELHPNAHAVVNLSALPSFNNDSDAVVIFDQRGIRIDSVLYRSSWGGGSGKSLERIEPSDESNLRTNWGTSISRASSTPGMINSLTQKEYDIAISAVNSTPAFPIKGDTLYLRTTIKNKGKQSAQQINIEFFEDTNHDSLPQNQELFSHQLLTSLAAGDSLVVSITQLLPSRNEHFFIIKASFTEEEDTSNNLFFHSVIVGYSQASVVVNEIMYAPSSPEPEWIELTAISDSINLNGWSISDKSSNTKYRITNSDLLLPPHQFLVLTRDSLAFLDIYPTAQYVIQVSWSSASLFNNDSDAVAIFDQRGLIIDSVSYRSSWGGKNNRSLERIEPADSSNKSANWGSSISTNRATPGNKNSLTPKDIDILVHSLSLFPSFPTIGDSIQLQSRIFNNGNNDVGSFAVSLYEDANGDSVFDVNEQFHTTTLSALSSGDSVIVQETRVNISFGNHLFMVRVTLSPDEDTTNNIRRASLFAGYPQQTIIINEIMYAPPSSEPEWVELYNNSPFNVDLKDWKISNKNSSTKYLVSNQHVFLNPQQYVLLTKDAARLSNSYPSIPAVMLEIPSLPSFHFTNTNDAVALFDSRNAMMDSVFYSSAWGGTNNRSLERREPDISSLSQSNWGTSTNPNNATPGTKNSLTRTEFDITVKQINFSPATPNAGESVQLQSVLFNKGKQTLNDFTVEFREDENGDSMYSLSEQLSLQQFHLSIIPLDSAMVTATTASLTIGTHNFLVLVTTATDE
ncbi:MAG: lamin tail domain-containing protein, partial [Ignavibacteriae bacterium]|nr:lamin tail domain-containing protein [Ignavibacteriota bacterium]